MRRLSVCPSTIFKSYYSSLASLWISVLITLFETDDHKKWSLGGKIVGLLAHFSRMASPLWIFNGFWIQLGVLGVLVTLVCLGHFNVLWCVIFSKQSTFPSFTYKLICVLSDWRPDEPMPWWFVSLSIQLCIWMLLLTYFKKGIYFLHYRILKFYFCHRRKQANQ